MSCLRPDAGLAAATPVTFTDVLHDDGEVSLTLDERAADERLIVFFPHRQSMGLDPDADPGRKFARKYGLNAAIIRMRRPMWFKQAGMKSIWTCLDRLRVRYPKITLCGASMGGYGAILTASRVPVSEVIAFAPIACIDPDGLPKASRFRADFQRLGDLDRPTEHLAGRYHVFVDRSHNDNRQLKMFDLPRDRSRVFSMTGVGHSIPEALVSAGLMSQVTLALADERVAPQIEHGLQAVLRQRKRLTPEYCRKMFAANLARRPAVAKAMLAWATTVGLPEAELTRMTRRLHRRLKQVARMQQIA